MNDHDDIYLRNIPIIKDTLNYQVEDGVVKVIIDNNKLLHRFFRKLRFKVANNTSITFDQYSSFVFLAINGERSVYEIGKLVKLKYGDECEPLYERLVTFIDFLEDDRRWILFKNKLDKQSSREINK